MKVPYIANGSVNGVGIYGTTGVHIRVGRIRVGDKNIHVIIRSPATDTLTYLVYDGPAKGAIKRTESIVKVVKTPHPGVRDIKLKYIVTNEHETFVKLIGNEAELSYTPPKELRNDEGYLIIRKRAKNAIYRPIMEMYGIDPLEEADVEACVIPSITSILAPGLEVTYYDRPNATLTDLYLRWFGWGSNPQYNSANIDLVDDMFKKTKVYVHEDTKSIIRGILNDSRIMVNRARTNLKFDHYATTVLGEDEF